MAISLAEEFNGELICSDSMQVYRQMDVGTAKPSLQEQNLIPHHQLDLINPDENYSAGQYARDTSGIIKKIRDRGSLPILVGGTGLYYRSLMYGISKIPPVPESLRKEITCWQQRHDFQIANQFNVWQFENELELPISLQDKDRRTL